MRDALFADSQFERPCGRSPVTALLVLVGALAHGPRAAHAEGHGPAFGLSTPTLARGQWSSDTVAMQLETEAGSMTMYREMLGYGITEDLQALLTVPLAQRADPGAMVTRTRVGVMMGAFEEVEASLLWRFHRVAPSVGARLESTLLMGLSVPTEARRGRVAASEGINVAAVTGYASRRTYWWLGAGLQHYLPDGGDQLGNLYYASAVLGWRPPIFRRDYPKPDWRVFLEMLGESAEKNRVADQRDPSSGGEKLLAGPSVLGLYGRWGVEAGVLWPILQSLPGPQPEERYRAKMVFTYWF